MRAIAISLLLTATAWTQENKLPDAPGKATFEKVCGSCHSAEMVLGRHESREGWNAVVNEMIQRGANGTDDEFTAVVDYLAANFGKDSSGQKPSAAGTQSGKSGRE